jgi:hypothetical protein
MNDGDKLTSADRDPSTPLFAAPDHPADLRERDREFALLHAEIRDFLAGFI